MLISAVREGTTIGNALTDLAALSGRVSVMILLLV